MKWLYIGPARSSLELGLDYVYSYRDTYIAHAVFDYFHAGVGYTCNVISC